MKIPLFLPLQIYELYNGGSVPVTYEIQTNILSQVREKNFDHPIFCCLNPNGEIRPGTTARVFWIFSPIEAKTYTVSGSPSSHRVGVWRWPPPSRPCSDEGLHPPA